MTALIEPAATCWRAAAATRAAVLVDGAAYFSALRSSLLAARQRVLIAGWDIDSRTRLPRTGDGDDAPEHLLGLLSALVRRHAGLEVYILLWDYTLLYAADREPLPRLKLEWTTPSRVHVCLDDALPFGASHHQKLVVIDDATAFCGGMDLTLRRWDTPAHRPQDPRRVTPDGRSYGPYHDVQMAVDGEAARALGELFRARWENATGRREAAPCDAPADPWPAGLAPDLHDVTVGIARTLPGFGGRDEVREVEALLCRAIDGAERRIYIENQYFTSAAVAEALARRLAREPRCEALLVGPEAPRGWLEEKTMGYGRRHFIRRLQDAGVADRVRLVCPQVLADRGPASVLVHAKVLVVDDRVLVVGSANLANRSMGLDSECNLAVEGRDASQRAAIAAVRNRLLGEHLGLEAEEVDAALQGGGYFELVDARRDAPRRLAPVALGGDVDEVAEVLYGAADPERPVAAQRFVGDMFAGHPVRPFWRGRRTLVIGAALAAVAAAVLAWRYTPLADLAGPERLAKLASRLEASAWAPLVVPAAFVAGGLVLVPVTALIAATAVVFGPWTALGYATAGAMASAALSFELGLRWGQGPMEALLGRWSTRVRRALEGRGVLAVAAMRLLPVAPFTVVNAVAGASRIGRLEFLLGTLIGLAPGLVLATVLGGTLRALWRDPGPLPIAGLVAVVALWLGLAFGLQRAVRRWRRRR